MIVADQFSEMRIELNSSQILLGQLTRGAAGESHDHHMLRSQIMEKRFSFSSKLEQIRD